MKDKRLKRIAIITLIIIITISCTIFLTSCGKDTYEIKLYDSNWNELEKDSSGYKSNYYEFKYDGTEKGFNAIAYKNKKEIYRYSYKNNSSCFKDNVIQVRCTFEKNQSYLIGSKVKFPIECGEYVLEYFFYIQAFSSNPHDIFGGQLMSSPDEKLIRFKIVN